MIELYKNIIKQLNGIINISQILGNIDQFNEPYLLLYVWNFIFKPSKNKCGYLDYEKMIRKIIMKYDSIISEKKISDIVVIL